MSTTNRQMILVDRPLAAVEARHFELRESPAPTPGDDEVLVRVEWLGFDPTQRGWLNDMPSYIPPVQIGEVMRASGVGEVVASNHPDYSPGDKVMGLLGWQEVACLKPEGMIRLTKVPDGVDPKAMLSIYGTTGLTAYFGMLDVAQPVEGDVVFVSGAAGSTGSIAGQIARLKGATVIGSAGSAEKCAWVTDVAGFDHCFNYKTDDTAAEIKRLAPKGLNVYFDNVGGPTLDAALANLAMNARVALCGGISSGYTMEELPPGPKNIMQLVIMRARMEGFLVIDYIPRFPEAIMQLAAWVAEGKIAYAEDIQHGLENAPATLARLFDGKNLGKQLLQL
jgi:NADPH-dependent curcumin reductase CurA